MKEIIATAAVAPTCATQMLPTKARSSAKAAPLTHHPTTLANT